MSSLLHPLFQENHRVHHHILSALLLSLIGVHSFLGVNHMLAAASFTVSALGNPTSSTSLASVTSSTTLGSTPLRSTTPGALRGLRDISSASSSTATTSSVTLAWNSAVSGATLTPVYDYTIKYRKVGSLLYKTYNDGVNTRTQVRISPLTKGMKYDFKVAARNKKGLGSYSLPLRVTVGSPVPTPSPGTLDPNTGIGTGTSNPGTGTSGSGGTTLPPVFGGGGGGGGSSGGGSSGGGGGGGTTPTPTPTPINGVCGTSNGQVLTTAPTNIPTTNLCTSGTASTVITNSSGSTLRITPDAYTWSCGGSGGGTTSSCSASKNILSGGTTGTGGTGGTNTGTTTPPVSTTTTYTYAWSSGTYGTCSVTCGGGIQSRTVVCRQTTSIRNNTTGVITSSTATVADTLCTSTTNGSTAGVKPTLTQSCNTQACTPAPTPTPTNQLPVATINTPATTTVSVTSGTAVNFAGSSVDPDGTIAAHEWRSGNCTTGTILSTVSTWNKSDFPVGTTVVYFRSRDNAGAWSTNCQSRSVVVSGGTTTPPVTPTNISLISDQRIMDIPNRGITYPAKGVPYIDANTGFKAMRLSDANEIDMASWGTPSILKLSTIIYARFTQVNTTGEFTIVYGDNSNAAIYRNSDAKLMIILRFKPSLGQSSQSFNDLNELRWDYTGAHPYRIYFVGYGRSQANSVQGENPNMSFYYTEFNPTTGVQSNPVLIRDFSADFPGTTGGTIMNDVEGDSSIDSRYWSWMVMNTSLGSGYRPYVIFTYDKLQNKITGRLQRNCTQYIPAGSTVPCVVVNTPAQPLPYITRPNMVEVSPLGTRTLVHWERAYTGNNEANIGGVADAPRAFLLDYTDPIHFASDATHSGWGWGPNGEELFFSQNNRNDYFEAVDIRTAATANCTTIIAPNSYSCGTKVLYATDLDPTWATGFHAGKFYDRNMRGVFAMFTMGENQSTWAKNQILMVQLNDATVKKSKVIRMGPNYNTYYDYFSEGHGGLDFAGNGAYITGNYGFVDGRGDAFKVEFPTDWYTKAMAIFGSIGTPTPTPINGVCGTSNNQTLTSAPTTNLCTTGTAGTVTTGTSSFTWSCGGSNGGTTASCSAARTVTPPPTNQLPVATINTPATATVSVTSGTAVNFAGSSVDPDGTIAAHEWRSGNCTTGTILSTVSTWSKSDFPVGTTLVYFRSRDNAGAWSTNCQSRSVVVSGGTTPSPTYTYAWSSGTYGTCSVTCGGGTQSRTVVCRRSDATTVADSFCTTTKPTLTQSCNTQACTPTTTPTSLISDKRIINIPNTGSYPLKGVKITDPVTNFTYTRATDKSELIGDYNNTAPSQSLIVYSRFSPTNTTGEFYIVHGENSTSAWLYRTSDNKMMTPLKFKPSLGTSVGRSLGELNEIRWDYTGQFPYRIYFIGYTLPSSQSVQGENPNMSFYYTEFNPTTGVQSNPVLIRNFSADFPGATGGGMMNDVEGDSSNDSRYWSWMVMNTTLGTGYRPYAIFTYDKLQNKLLGRLQRNCTQYIPAGSTVPCTVVNTPAETLPYLTRPNMVEMSPLGTRVIVDWERVYPGYGRDSEIGLASDGPKAFLPNFTDPIRIGSDATHSGWGWGKNGEEMFVSQNNRNDWIEAVDIKNATTANCTLIAAPNSYSCGLKLISQPDLDGGTWTIGYHFGKIYDQTKKGFIFMNTYDSAGYTFWGKNQELFVEINDATVRPSKVYRLGSTYNTYYDYRSEGSAALDFKGETIWGTANWGFVDGRAEVLKLDLPTNLYSQLSWGATTPPPTPTPVSGVCGTSNGTTLSTAPTTNLCTTGTTGTVTTGISSFTWSCGGTNGGNSVSCSASRSTTTPPTPTPVNGVCGTSNNQTLASAPTTNLCTTGTAGTVTTGTSSFTWSCGGTNGGSSVSCGATKSATQTPTTISRVSTVITTDPDTAYWEGNRSSPGFQAIAGNLIVVSVEWTNAGGTTSINVSDTAGNSYIAGPVVAPTNMTNRVQQFYALSSKVAANNIITITGVGGRDEMDFSAVQYSAGAGKVWSKDGTTAVASTDFVGAPISTNTFSTTGNGVINSIVTATYPVASFGSSPLDSLVHQFGSSVVLERFTQPVTNTTVTATIDTVGNGPYGRYAISTSAFKAQ